MVAAEFRLTDEDRIALAQLRPGGSRWVGVAVLVVILAPLALMLVVVLGDLDTTPLWVYILSGVCALQLAWTGSSFIPSRSSVPRVLAGAAPTVAVVGRMFDAEGEAPHRWSMQLDEPVESYRYVYFGAGDPAWLLTQGARVRLYLFGTTSIHDIAMVESVMDGRRHWMRSANFGERRAYVYERVSVD